MLNRLTWAIVLVISIHNFFAYDPALGYDGDKHLVLVKYFAAFGAMPTTRFYGASNPPLYYWLASLLYQLGPSDKTIQVLSLVLSLMGVAMFRRLAREYSQGNDRVLNLGTLFYALLPLTVEYGVMVFNYTLANFLSVASLFVIHRVLGGKRAHPAMIVLLMLLAIANVFTSLTGLAAFLMTVLVIGVLINCPLRTRVGYSAIFAALVLATLVPYAAARKKQYGCVLCSMHRVSNERDPKQAENLTWVEFSADEFWRPVFQGLAPVSVASGLYETFYGDYFNYLVPRRLSSRAPSHEGLVFTGKHYIDARRIALLRWQNFVGVLLSLGFLAALYSLARSGKWLDFASPSWRVRAAYFTFSALTVLQFIRYIQTYPNGCNSHAGYLYPITFIGGLCFVRYLSTSTRLALAMQGVTFGYTLVNAWVFWL